MFLTTAPTSERPDASPPSDPVPDGTRAGATWVAATGAFLLVAAAAVFVAVRWDTLPEAAKLALVGALTGGFLAGGRALRRTLPATGDVLFHLGAFLVPVDVAGIGVRLSLGWRSLLLTEGVVGVAVLGGLAAGTASVVLAWAAAAATVVAALGLAAVSPVPAPLALALAAAVALVLGRRRTAVAWAALAGLAPVLGAGTARVLAAAAGRDLGTGTLAELGLAGRSAALLAVVSSVVCALVLGREAGRRHDLGLVALAGASLVSGAATTWAAAAPSDDTTFLTLPALFVAVQLGAAVARRDAFWDRPARWTAFAAEVVALPAALYAALLVLVAPVVEDGIDVFSDAPAWTPEPVAAVAWSLLAAGWVLAAWRRQGAQSSPLASLRDAVVDGRTVVLTATVTMAAMVVGTASTVAVSAALIVLAAGLALSRRPVAIVVAVVAAGWAPVVVAVARPGLVLPAALASAAVLTAAARAMGGRHHGAPTIALTLAASAVAFGGALQGTEHLGTTPALLIGVFAAWATAAAVEGWGAGDGRQEGWGAGDGRQEGWGAGDGRQEGWGAGGGRQDSASSLAGFIGRAPLLLITGVALAAPASDAVAVVVAATLLLVVDAVRLDDPRIAFGTALTAPACVFTASQAFGLDLPATGVVLAVAATVLGGLSLLTPDRWRLAVLVAAGPCFGAGLALASPDQARLADVVILGGGLLVAAGIGVRQHLLGHVGGAAIAVGMAIHLDAVAVTASEPYVAPVALHLLLAGWLLRRRQEPRPSSWVAFGPAVALLGFAALAERVDGGPAWHALVAGAVGVAAVAAGGWLRLSAPLFLGTALVVAVTFLESLHTLAGVPTWAWLATGGTVLLAAGVALERTATSPVQAGRRLVDVVSDRFD